MSVAVLITVLLMLFSRQLLTIFDSTLLSEYANGFYSVMGRYGEKTDFYLPSNSDEYDAAYNYLYLDTCNVSRKGMNISVNDDHSLTINGVNEDKGYDLYLGYVVAPVGEYRLSGGPEDRSIGYLYITGVESGNKAATTSENDIRRTGDRFEVQSAIDVNLLFLHIEKNSCAENVKIYPMVSPSEIKEEMYTPPAVVASCLPGYYEKESGQTSGDDGDGQYHDLVKVIRIEKEQYHSLSRHDKEYITNYISRVASQEGYSRVSLDYMDGTGVEFPNCDIKNGQSGMIDAWGRVNFK